MLETRLKEDQKAGCANLAHMGMGVDNRGVEMNQEHLLDVSKVAEIFGCSARTVWRWRDEKLMPEPIVIGRVVRWSYYTIMGWIGARCPKGDATERSV